MTDRCAIGGCRADAALDYLGHGVCDHHWAGLEPAALRAALGINADESSAKEDTMARKKQIETETTPTTEAAPTAPAPKPKRAKSATIEKAAPPAADNATATETAPKPKRGRKPRAAEPVAEAAPEKLTRTKKAEPAEPEAPKADLVIFAFRLTQAERDAIHQTAGPRNATQFVRRVAVAFAQEDKAAFDTVIKEARQMRG